MDGFLRRPFATAILMGVAAVLLQPLYLMVVGYFTPFPAWGYLFWLPWLLVMGPGMTLLRWVGPKTVSPLGVTLFSLVFGALLWSCLTYGLLVWYSRRRRIG